MIKLLIKVFQYLDPYRKVLILGFSYKANTADFRNTGVAEIYKKLSEFNMNIKVIDPWIDKIEALLVIM